MDHIWPYMVIYGPYIAIYALIYDHIWPYMDHICTIYGHIRPYMPIYHKWHIYGHVWLYMAIFGAYLAICNHICPYMDIILLSLYAHILTINGHILSYMGHIWPYISAGFCSNVSQRALEMRGQVPWRRGAGR